MNIIELRNYLLKPGVREKFISHFKEHFIVSQQSMGAYIPGLFRIKDEDDRFFWIRGFNDMEERSRFLPAFYSGEVWKESGPAANDMMLEWHHVHLLRPLAGCSAIFDRQQGLLVIDYYSTGNNQRDGLINHFTGTCIPLYKTYGIDNISLWISEMTRNDFPKLPVYQEENLLVVITGYDNEAEYESITETKNSAGEVNDKITEFVKSRKTLVLYPA